ncbi:MAG: pyridoxamine 5'-phosphate oxidase family protein [Pseudomonadota bacterium]|nr:general stress protein [Pseudomonadales bacterium]MDY6920960.1 pyridoxamine 5'-phosphate oxidase family protein [Pseudomonadota bacterium]
MSSLLKQVQDSPADALWDELDKVIAVMLGVEGTDTFMCPMAPMVDREANTIWFFTRKDNDRFATVADGVAAKICLTNEGDHFWACINGRVMKQVNPDVIERFWSPMVEAWYEGGIKDDNILLLAFQPEMAEISCSTKSTLRFGWEIAKANLKGEEKPDLGVQTRVRLG